MTLYRTSARPRIISLCLLATLVAACTVVKVPDVVGDSESVATTAITTAGLVVGIVEMQTSSTVPPGTVISEFPAANATIQSGSKVDLVVSSGVTFGGVVAAGSAVANNPGYALDAVTGTQIPFVTDANGNYTVDVYGYAGPFLLRVLGVTTGGTPVDLYSLASTSSTTVNVTPLSDLVLGYAAGVTTSNLEATCTGNLPGCPALLNGILASLTTANSSVVAAIPASVWSAFGITPATFNAITSQFATTHTGVDGLLDALSIVPPETTGASYTVSLVGATPTLLATVPTSGTAGTEGGPPVASPPPTSAAIAQAANLAAILPEIQTQFFDAVNALFAASTPPTAAQLQALLAPNFLFDGATAGTLASELVNQPQGFTISGGAPAPYSAAPFTGSGPGPAVTYDANNCVTSVWVYANTSGQFFNFVDTIPSTNAPGVCTGGTWLWAGNGRTYQSEIYPKFDKFQGTIGGTPTYVTSFYINTKASDTDSNPSQTAPYHTVFIYGPGLTNVSAPNATAPGWAALRPAPPPITNIEQTQNELLGISEPDGTPTGPNGAVDPYYAGNDALQSCQAILNGTGLGYGAYTPNTPCYNSAVAAGSDYVVTFYYNGNQVGGAQQVRFPISLTGVTLPTSYYPTITSVTPASTAIPLAGGIVTTTWTLPLGATDDSQGIYLGGGAAGTLFQLEQNLAPTVLTHTISVSALSSAVVGGNSHLNTVIAGFNVGTNVNF